MSNDDRKSTVFSSRRNVVSDGAFLTDDGRLFHARAEATGKARSPSIERLVDGTTSMAESAERRRRRVSTMSGAGSQQGMPALFHMDSGRPEHSRNATRSGTLKQWSSRSNGVMRSDRLAEKTKRAAAFKMDCSQSCSWPWIPARTEESQETASVSAECSRRD